MTSARLPQEIEQQLAAVSKAKHLSKSELVKEALVQYFAHEESEKDSYELGAGFFGKYGSGDGNLSSDYKKRLRDKVGAKYHTR
jgi:predicted DNA-binding protein